MKKKILYIMYIILIIIMMKLIYNIVTNQILINQFNDSETNQSLAKFLTVGHLVERYISHYNYGNVLYENEEYEDAISEYEKALDCYVPNGEECNIRINYALAICGTVELDESDKDSIDSAIDTYEGAIDVLTEDECADTDETVGHSEDATTLKKDIEEEIERLKKLKDTDKSTNEKNEKQEIQKEKKVEEQIKALKENAISEQREVENDFKNFSSFSFDRPEKYW